MKQRTLLAVLLGGVVLAVAGAGAWTTASKGAEAEPPAEGVVFVELTVAGNSIGFFSEPVIASGLDVGEFQLATRPGDILKLPGTRRPPSVTLKRGLTSNLELAAWHELAMLDNAAARKSVTLTMLNVELRPVARWQFENAWPSKYDVSGLGGGAGSVMFETITIVADKLQRVAV